VHDRPDPPSSPRAASTQRGASLSNDSPPQVSPDNSRVLVSPAPTNLPAPETAPTRLPVAAPATGPEMSLARTKPTIRTSSSEKNETTLVLRVGKRRSEETADPEYNKKIAVKAEEGRLRVGTLEVNGPCVLLDKYAVPVDTRKKVTMTKVEISRRRQAKKEKKRETPEEFAEWHERVLQVVQLDQERAATQKDLDQLDQAHLEATRDFIQAAEELRDLYNDDEG
jgi:hypothetical protein